EGHERKGGAERVQGAGIGDRDAEVALVPARPSRTLVPLRPGHPGEKRSLRSAIRAAVDEAVYGRRVFVLLPFAMIAGLIAYAQLPFEPHPWALSGMAVALVVLLVLVRTSPLLPLAAL